jgi:uncharacterized protein with von Willebrand factor type A (vWA) domain
MKPASRRCTVRMSLENPEGSDIYFLVDRSGSMAGEKWTKTVEALIAFTRAAAQHPNNRRPPFKYARILARASAA